MLRSVRLAFLLFAFAFAAAVALFSSNSVSAAAEQGSSDRPDSNPIKVIVNGIEYAPESAPFSENGNVYLPVRDIGELLGTTVSWIASADTVAMNFPELTVKLKTGSMTATVNGSPVSMNAPLQMVDGRVFVPLRFFFEAVRAEVEWMDATKTVSITRSNDFIKQYIWSVFWLNPGNGDLYMARDEQSPAVHVGRLELAVQGELTFEGGLTRGGNTVLTVVDRHGGQRDQYDAYSVLIHDNRIVSQKKASYSKRYEQNATYYQVYDPAGWIEYTVLTDGKIVSVFDKEGEPVKAYNLPELAGADDNYSVLAVGSDYLEVRPNTTGLLMLIDLKDHSTVVLADKLLSGKDLEYAHNNEVPYRGDTLMYGGDQGYGVLSFFYVSPFGDKNGEAVRLTYERPSYEAERNAIPKGRSLSEMASGCSPETVASVNLQDGDLVYLPLIGADAEDRDSINTVCGILKKFAARGVEETLPEVMTETFFHGMEIGFTEGDSIAMYTAGAGKLAIGYEQGGKTTVLNDAGAAQDFVKLKTLPTELAMLPNPAHFGETVHFEGDSGDPGESSPLTLSWWPLNYDSGLNPDPSLIVYTGTTKFGHYNVDFAMPAFGKASDGTMKPIPPGKGKIILSPQSWASSAFVELLPADKPFLSVNGVPDADPSHSPLTVAGHIMVPVRAIAALAGQPVIWDAKTGCILIRTKTSTVTGASKRGAELWIDGKKAAAELQPVVRNGTAYLPIRAVTAAFGLPVLWDGASRSVNVTVKPSSPPGADK